MTLLYFLIALLAMVVLVLGLGMLLFKRFRRRGKWTAAAATCAFLGSIVAFDHANMSQAKDEAARLGYFSVADKQEAERLGLRTPDELMERRREDVIQQQINGAAAVRQRADAERSRQEEVASEARRRALENEQRQVAASVELEEARRRNAAQAAAMDRASSFLPQGCRAAIAVEMGRDPRTMAVSPSQPDGDYALEVRYRRPDDGTLWRVVCRLTAVSEEGAEFEWATMRENGSVGRWRNDARYDNRLTIKRDGQFLLLTRRFPSGESSTRRFSMAELTPPNTPNTRR